LLRDQLVIHPRIAAQPQIVEATGGARLAAELPPLVPFDGAEYVGGDWILDWDHRLPSRQSILRLSAYYTEGRRQAARAAREREKRVTRALAELPAARDAKREDAAKANARVSMTDPDARVMKMADGGYRPAYNVQLATAVEQRTGQQPREYLVDGGFVQLESIAAAAADGVTVYAPVRKPPRADIDPHVAKPTDAPAVAAWRVRMGTEDAKTIYKDRAAVAETVNADLRAHRGLNRLPVRGLAKVQCIAVWAALTYNVLRWLALTA